MSYHVSHAIHPCTRYTRRLRKDSLLVCCMHLLLVPCVALCPTVAGRSSRAATMIRCATEVQFRQTCVRICILLLGFDVFVVSARKELAGAVVVLVWF